MIFMVGAFLFNHYLTCISGEFEEITNSSVEKKPQQIQ